MSLHRRGRRMFLRGAAGAALAIPFLPSLLRRSAKADDTGLCCFLSMRTNHGGLFPAEFAPPQSMLTADVPLDGVDWSGRMGALQPEARDGNMFLSQVLNAPASLFSPELIAGMNVILGLDYSIYPGHNVGYHLGAYASGLNQSGDTVHRATWGPTIDQLIAYSPGFTTLSETGAPAEPVPIVGAGVTVGHVVPTDPTTRVVAQRMRSESLWQRIFRPGGPAAHDGENAGAVRVAGFNAAFRAYQGLHSASSSAGRRLSVNDRLRLERHMDTVADLRGRFDAASMCDGPEEPASSLRGREQGEVRGAIIRAAVECGLSRVFTFDVYDTTVRPAEVSGMPEHDFAHWSSANGNQSEGSSDVMRARAQWPNFFRNMFEATILPLVQGLNFEDGMGRNVLDNSLALLTSEAGMETHLAASVPVVTFGSLGGKIATGQFFDYRSGITFGRTENQRNSALANRAPALRDDYRSGLVYDQLMGTILRGYGVDLSEYDRYRARPVPNRDTFDPGMSPAVGGYGAYHAEQSGNDMVFYHDAPVRDYADTLLPGFWIG